MQTFALGDRLIGEKQPAFIIAEAGINHNGHVERATEMIAAAQQAGADAIKFQTFTARGLMTRSAGAAVHLQAGAGDEDLYSFVDRLSLSVQDHEGLAGICREFSFPFLSTAGDPEGVALLASLGVPAFKVASMDLDNLPLLTEVARAGKPVLLSTGMATLAELDTALETIHRAGNDQVILLHCTSLYPAPPETVNLRAMVTMRTTFGLPVGYSDHTSGITVPLAAAALGACIIEKHFTLDTALPGPDQSFSADPDELARLVAAIRCVEQALGSGRKRPAAAEMAMRSAFRRSIVAARDIPAGAVLNREMLAFKRPGSGISPGDLAWVIGRQTTRPLPEDTVITQRDLV
ncbi:MAG: N-acetylneuraminate synthase family protein [Acidobacteriota bacterium]